MIKILEFLGQIFTWHWVEYHLVYFSLLGGIVIFFLIILILIKWQKDINRIDKKTREFIIKIMRETSPKKKKEKIRLKF